MIPKNLRHGDRLKVNKGSAHLLWPSQRQHNKFLKVKENDTEGYYLEGGGYCLYRRFYRVPPR